LLASFDEQLLLKSFLVDTVRFSQEKKDRIAFGKKTPGYKKRDKSFSYKPELFEKYRDFLYGINEDTKKVTLNKFQNGVKQILSVNTP